MNPTRRKTVLAGGVATVAVAAGLGWSLWRQRAAALDTQTRGALWSSSFDTPDGSKLALAAFRGQPLLLNFWATWCPPCIREMPTIDRFAREFGVRGWRVVGLAADNLAPVRKFLASVPVSYPIGLTGFAGIELSQRLGNTSGGLPFTIILDRTGEPVQRQIGEARYEQLAQWAQQLG